MKRDACRKANGGWDLAKRKKVGCACCSSQGLKSAERASRMLFQNDFVANQRCRRSGASSMNEGINAEVKMLVRDAGGFLQSFRHWGRRGECQKVSGN